ncbi:DUF6300 family protein [Streptomyces sp. NPDC006285]|uniref:DUF6300 family protein n=1 Tax=Streptomyces sp. NPDC006285 TaxID=3364742 RepID=UPI0036A2AB3F
MISKQREEEILVRIEATPPCPQCNETSLLLARFPYSWKNGRGEDVSGLREAVLCAGCHHGEPAAAELLALFAVDDQVSPPNQGAFGGLVAAWVESVRHRTVDLALLDEEHERWSRGEL